MVDARDGVARETVDAWLNGTFAVPLSLRNEVMEPQRAQRGQDIHDAILDSLPQGKGRSELLALCETVRKRLVRASKAATWPTAAEVIEAFRAEGAQTKAEGAGEAGWPHRNSEFVLEAAANWVRRFGAWPNWLEHPAEVARELVARGAFQMAALIRAGYRATAAEREAAGISWGRYVTVNRVPAGRFD